VHDLQPLLRIFVSGTARTPSRPAAQTRIAACPVPITTTQRAALLASPAASAPAPPTKPPVSQLVNHAQAVGGRGYRRLVPTEQDITAVPDIWEWTQKQCPNQIAVSLWCCAAAAAAAAVDA
jgi:hypothetical protein